LQPDAKEIFSAYKILQILLPGANGCDIMQYDNYIFRQEKFEIKLTHQIGKTDKYNFEVEAVSETVNLNKILKGLGLLKLVTITNVEFWDKWNDELNLKGTDLNEKQTLELIKKYLFESLS